MRVRIAAAAALLLLCASGCKGKTVTDERAEVPAGAAPVEPEAVKPKVSPATTPGRLPELDDIAANIARDPTLGVFVVTNRRPLNIGNRSFSDELSTNLTYGVAYQKVTATVEGVSASQAGLSFEPATRKNFDRYVSDLEAKATRYPRHVAVFVHGFNQTPQQAMTTAVAVRSLLQFDGPLVLFMWPSAGATRNYPTDRLRAEASEATFARLLCDLAKRTSGGRLTVLAHSMGSYLTSNALSDFEQHSTVPRRPS